MPKGFDTKKMPKDIDPKKMPPMAMGDPVKTIKRLLKYFGAYKGRFIVVLLCIIFSAAAGVASSLFIQILIDNYITPLLVADKKDFSGLLSYSNSYIQQADGNYISGHTEKNKR